MALTSTVWMIHRFTNPRTGVRGDLTLESEALFFRPASGSAPTAMRLSDIIEVDRVANSPVLTVRFIGGHRLPEALFYFVEPPYMFGKPTKITLRVADSFLHEEVSEWVRAIQAAIEGEWGEDADGGEA